MRTLPGTVEEGISALESSKALRDNMGSSLVTEVALVLKANAAYYKDKDEAFTKASLAECF